MTRIKKKLKITSFDYETTGISTFEGYKPFAYCIGNYTTGNVKVYRLDNKNENVNKRNFKILKDYFADTSIIKVCHNFKFEYHHTKALGIKIPKKTIWHDTMIMAQVMRNDEKFYDLSYLPWKYGRYKCEVDEFVEREGRKLGGYQHVEKKIMNEYQIADGERTLLLYGMYMQALEKDTKRYADYLNEIALIPVTAEMEEYGLNLCKWGSVRLKNKLKKDCEDCLQKLSHISKEDLDSEKINSPKFMRELVFEKLGYPIEAKTKTGLPAMDKDALISLWKQFDSKFFEYLLKYKSYNRGITMIDSYTEFAKTYDGKIHSNIKTNGAERTGRQSSTSPNLQNVSKSSGVTEKTPFPVPMRSLYRAPKDHYMLFVDYAQIELRLIVDAAKEPEMIDALEKKIDLHHLTVECFLGVDDSAKLRDTDYKTYTSYRSIYKNVGFGVAYGSGEEKVAQVIGKPFEEIESGLHRYKNRFRKIANFSKSLISLVRKQGYIITAFGRVLYVPKSKAYRASNYIIQGTAAGILKRAQVNVAKLIEKKYKGILNMVLPIHDELVFTIHKDHYKNRKIILGEVSRVMCDMPEIDAPMEVEWKMSRTTWDRAREIKI